MEGKAQEYPANGAPATVTVDPTELEVLRRSSEHLLEAANGFRGLQLRCEQSIAKAGDIYKLLLKAQRDIEEERKGLTAPILAAKKNIDAKAKKIMEPFKIAAGVVKACLDENAQWRREEERKAQKEIDDAVVAAAEKAEAEGRTEDAERVVQTGASMVPEKKAPARGQAATVSTRKTWRFEIVDKDAVPERFKVVNLALVREGMREQLAGGLCRPGIPGIKFWQHEEANVR